MWLSSTTQRTAPGNLWVLWKALESGLRWSLDTCEDAPPNNKSYIKAAAEPFPPSSLQTPIFSTPTGRKPQTGSVFPPIPFSHKGAARIKHLLRSRYPFLCLSASLSHRCRVKWIFCRSLSTWLPREPWESWAWVHYTVRGRGGTTQIAPRCHVGDETDATPGALERRRPDLIWIWISETQPSAA